MRNPIGLIHMILWLAALGAALLLTGKLMGSVQGQAKKFF